LSILAGIVKRSVTIAGHRTSVSLEEPFWRALAEIADTRNQSLAGLIAGIDRQRTRSGARQGLSSALRVHVLEHYWAGAEAEAGEVSTKSSQRGVENKSNSRK